MKATAYYIVLAAAVVGVLWLVISFMTQDENSQETAAQKAAEDTAKAENPFAADNPLSKIEANPLEKTKKVLNPFE